MDIRKSNIEGNNNFVIQGDNNTITLDNSFSANLMPQNESDEKTIRLLMHNMNVYLITNPKSFCDANPNRFVLN